MLFKCIKSKLNLRNQALIATCIVTLAILLYGANGIRGTDQYWYMADIESIVAREAPLTNIYYPAKLLREGTTKKEPNYFMHNGPLLYATAMFSRFFGIYNSWIMINILSHITVAGVIFSISRKVTTRAIATVTCCLYLISPIAIWQSINLLQEQLYAGLLALAIWGIVVHEKFWPQVLSWIAILIGIFSHPIFLILGLLQALGWIIRGLTDKTGKHITIGLCLALLYIISKGYVDTLFPSSFQPNLNAIISGSVPGVSNMMWHYSLDQVPVNFELLWGKFAYAASEHFFTLRNWPLYIYTNLALFAFPLIFFLKVKKYSWPLLLALGTSLSAYVAILVLMQTQARYQQIVAAASFITIAIALYEIRAHIQATFSYRALQLCLVSMFIVTLGISGFMAHQASRQSTLEAAAMQQLSDVITELPEDAKIVLIDTQHELKLSYALRPRDVLTMRSDFLAEPYFSGALELFKPTHAISFNKTALSNDRFFSTPDNVKQFESAHLGVVYIRPFN